MILEAKELEIENPIADEEQRNSEQWIQIAGKSKEQEQRCKDGAIPNVSNFYVFHPYDSLSFPFLFLRRLNLYFLFLFIYSLFYFCYFIIIFYL